MVYYVSLLIISCLCYFTYALVYLPARQGRNISENEAKELKKPEYLDSTCIVFFVCVAYLFVRAFSFQFVNIPSESMLPNFVVSQKLLLDKSRFGYRNPLNNEAMSSFEMPNRGQVVITQFPLNPDVLYLKRIVALPGDELSMSSNAIVINGVSYAFEHIGEDEFTIGDKTYLHDIYQIDVEGNRWKLIKDKSKPFPVIEKITIPQDAIYLLGDNLTASSDSRFFGPISSNHLIAGLY